jgi:hypothetical protein
VADHFQYLASIGFIAAVASALTRLVRSALAARLGGLLLIGPRRPTWRQVETTSIRSRSTGRRLPTNPDSWIAHHNLAAELAARNDPVAACPMRNAPTS